MHFDQIISVMLFRCFIKYGVCTFPQELKLSQDWQHGSPCKYFSMNAFFIASQQDLTGTLFVLRPPQVGAIAEHVTALLGAWSPLFSTGTGHDETTIAGSSCKKMSQCALQRLSVKACSFVFGCSMTTCFNLRGRRAIGVPVLWVRRHLKTTTGLILFCGCCSIGMWSLVV